MRRGRPSWRIVGQIWSGYCQIWRRQQPPTSAGWKPSPGCSSRPMKKAQRKAGQGQVDDHLGTCNSEVSPLPWLGRFSKVFNRASGQWIYLTLITGGSMGARGGSMGLVAWACSLVFLMSAAANAEQYELTESEVMDIGHFNTADVSLFGIKIGDSEAKVKENLIKIKIPGVKVEVQGRNHGDSLFRSGYHRGVQRRCLAAAISAHQGRIPGRSVR